MTAKPNKADFGQVFATNPSEKKQVDIKPKETRPRQVSFYIPGLAQIQLKILAIQARTTQQALILDGINEVFKKHGLPTIAM